MRSMRLLMAVPALLLAAPLAGCEVAADAPAPPTPSPVAPARPPAPFPDFSFPSEEPRGPAADRTPDVLARIPVGGQPSDLALAPVTGRLYVSSRSGGITVIDTVSRKAVATFEAGKEPFGLAVDEVAGLLYVADAQTEADGRVVVVDTATREVVDTIPVGDRAWPVDVALDRDRGLLFVACNGNGTLAVVDTRTRQMVRTHDVGTTPTGVAIDARAGVAYVTGTGVTAVDIATLLVLGTADATGGRIAVDPLADAVLVAEEGRGTVALIDAATLQVAEEGRGTVALIDAATLQVAARAEVGGRGPFTVVPDVSRGLTWVTGAEDGGLYILTTQDLETVARLDPPRTTGPWFGIAAVDPVADVVYVTLGADLLVLERI